MSVRIAAINYLNTLPFVYGLSSSAISKQLEVVYCTPSQAAQMLENDQVDLGIVPAVLLSANKKYETVSNYCIAADGKVKSVLLCSPVPLENVSEIYADSDSRSSITLARLLSEKFWLINPEFKTFDYSTQELDVSKAYVLIGDKALINSEKFEYVYDLSEQWLKYTGKPFVFAAWVANKPLEENFISDFNEALGYGLANIEQAVDASSFLKDKKFTRDEMISYLRDSISYDFTNEKKEGLAKFLELVCSSSNLIT